MPEAPPVSESVLPMQTVVLDAEAVAVGRPFIVMVAWAAQPLLFVYVITGDRPVATPVTTPPLVTVAYEVFDEVHGLDAAGLPEPVRVTVAPTHTLSVPEIVGVALTVSVAAEEVADGVHVPLTTH